MQELSPSCLCAVLSHSTGLDEAIPKEVSGKHSEPWVEQGLASRCFISAKSHAVACLPRLSLVVSGVWVSLIQLFVLLKMAKVGDFCQFFFFSSVWLVVFFFWLFDSIKWSHTKQSLWINSCNKAQSFNPQEAATGWTLFFCSVW